MVCLITDGKQTQQNQKIFTDMGVIFPLVKLGFARSM
jgi:hypothetical protein